MVHDIDVGVFLFFRGLWGKSPGLDEFVEMLASNSLLKAGPILVMIWCLWFVREGDVVRRRMGIASLLVAACCAAAFSVALTKVLPLRPRPMFEPSLGSTLQMPDWSRVSSLPSDHAAMFIALAVGLMFVSRRWGVVALVDALLFICLPRAYLGLHYVADLVVGALIGVTFACLFNSGFVRRHLSSHVVAFESARAPVFYGALFVLSLEIADLFHGARQVVAVAAHAGAWVRHGLAVALN
ncbi:MAG TPA: phosphatase PAP2 family protein [Burkholderiaceae bacterium]|nr:phosphatase PAP2 family protein [Burkholderiaceae bacterium]